MGVDLLTDDASVITLSVEPSNGSRKQFSFLPGQHLVVRSVVDDQLVRRSYSICSPVGSDELRIAVRRVEGGALSNHLLDSLRPGDTLDAMTPAGRFGTSPDPTRTRRYAAVAAGSGITPILSIITSVLEVEASSTFLLVYGNRDARSVMFVEELADLKDRFGARLEILHVLSREVRGHGLLDGRVTTDIIDVLLTHHGGRESVDDWFLCGPRELVEEVQDHLVRVGVADDHVHSELFYAGPASSAPTRRMMNNAATAVRFSLGGTSGTADIDGNEFVLDAVLRARPDAPYSCKGGVCGTCRAKVVRGAVEMESQYALEQDELDAGYVLACRAVASTPGIELDFDA